MASAITFPRCMSQRTPTASRVDGVDQAVPGSRLHRALGRRTGGLRPHTVRTGPGREGRSVTHSGSYGVKVRGPATGQTSGGDPVPACFSFAFKAIMTFNPAPLWARSSLSGRPSSAAFSAACARMLFSNPSVRPRHNGAES